MPLRIGFVTAQDQSEKLLEITKLKETFIFPLKEKVALSLNRGFSAPVNIEYPYEIKDLYELMARDADAYCRYEATQKIYDTLFKTEFSHYKISGELNPELSPDFKEAFGQMLRDQKIDPAFKSYLLDLPTENGLAQESIHPDFDTIHYVHQHLKQKIGVAFQDWFRETYLSFKTGKFELTPEAFGARALKNQCLSFFTATGTKESHDLLEQHYTTATNMTEEIGGLALLVQMGAGLDHPMVISFYEKWKTDTLVMQKWFSVLSAYSPKESVLSRLQTLEKDPLFDNKIPNFLRALYVQFARSNLHSFHALDGSGYHFMAERIRQIDKYNPQLASKAASSFSMIQKLDSKRASGMKAALGIVMADKPSRDTFEVISKYLN